MDISAWTAHWSNWTPEKTALRFEGGSISYGELERRVAAVAGWLLARGVSRGDRVAFLGYNGPELLELLFACARLGAIFVPLNARMPAAELRVFMDQGRPRLVVAEQSLQAVAVECVAHVAGCAVRSFEPGHGLNHVSGGPSACMFDPQLDPTSPVLIAYTSGTTGQPKGATFTHQNLAANALAMVTALALTARDEVLNVAAMFHVVGLALLTLPALCAGATVTIHREFDPGRLLHDVARFGVTLLASVPAMTQALAAHPGWSDADLSSLRYILTGSTFVRRSGIEPWRQKGVAVLQGYGLTETLPGGGASVPPGDAPEKALTAGKPKMFHQLRIVDPAGREVPAGEPGEVWISGPCVMQGYWENPEATRAAFQDGWFRSGDVGFIDEEGYLHILDRMKEMIIVGVSNVYPADLEAVLTASPAIAEAAVVGLPDDELGEVPVAFVIRAPGASLTEEEALELFQDHLASYKHPRHVFFVDGMPRTAVGKIEKKTLRNLARSLVLGDQGNERGRPQLIER